MVSRQHFAAFAVAVVLFLLFVGGDVVRAQNVLPPAPASTFAACLRLSPEFVAMEGTITTNLATEGGSQPDIRELARRAWTCSLEYADAELVPRAGPVFIGIALIMVVWTGARMMFGGGGDVAGNLGFVFMLLFGYAILLNYYSPTVVPTIFGDSRGVAHTIAGGGIMIAEEIFQYGDDIYLPAYAEAKENLSKGRADSEGRLDEAVFDPPGITAIAWQFWQTKSLTGLIDAYTAPLLDAAVARWTFVAGQMMQWLFLGLLWVLYWVLLAQYLWGYVAVAVLSLVGPLFVPFLLVPQLDWLGWGWIKALVNAAVHMIVAAATYTVGAIMLSIPVTRLANLDMPDDWSMGLVTLSDIFGVLFVAALPTFVLAGSAAMSVGSTAQALVSGSPPAAAGLARRAAAALAGAATAVSPLRPLSDRPDIPSGGPGGLGAPAGPLSQSTIAGAAQAAYASVRSRTGPSPGQPSGPSSTLRGQQAFDFMPPGPNRLERELGRTFKVMAQRFQQLQLNQITPAQYLQSVNQAMSRAGSYVRADAKRTQEAFRRWSASVGPPTAGRPRRPSSSDHVPQPH